MNLELAAFLMNFIRISHGSVAHASLTKFIVCFLSCIVLQTILLQYKPSLSLSEVILNQSLSFINDVRLWNGIQDFEVLHNQNIFITI